MSTKLGLFTLNQLQKQLSQSLTQENLKTAWMWNPNDNDGTNNNNQLRGGEEEDDSWEVRAFAEDTGNIMGTTWPPRSYTCSFCRREFRSAQALGGHMNVHRRDRARLHQSQKNPISGASSSSPPPTFIIPTPPPEVATNGGLCLFYQLPPNYHNNPNCNMCLDSASTLLSISSSPSTMMRMMPSSSYSIKPTAADVVDRNGSQDYINEDQKMMVKKESSSSEELDLELRLGHGPVALK